MINPKLCYFHAITFRSNMSLLLIRWEPKPSPGDLFCILIIVVMAPIVRIEPNRCQALLSHDDAIDDLEAHVWDVFLEMFEGYNLSVSKSFAQTFDSFRAKIGDI
jgi:hypothetical protein